MTCSVIIPFSSSRLENLNQTIRFLCKENYFTKSQLILICNDFLKEKIPHCFEYFKVINLNSNNYCRANMCNLGVKESMFEKLVILDSDRILPNFYFSKYLNVLKPNECITTTKIKQIKQSITDSQIEENNYEYEIEYRSKNAEMHKKGMFSGNTIMNKSTYLEAGMMDESYCGYGYQDIDFDKKLSQIKSTMTFVDAEEIHLFHTRDLTTLKYIKSNVFNGIKFCKKWKLQPEKYLIEAGKKIDLDVLYFYNSAKLY